MFNFSSLNTLNLSSLYGKSALLTTGPAAQAHKSGLKVHQPLPTRSTLWLQTRKSTH